MSLYWHEDVQQSPCEGWHSYPSPRFTLQDSPFVSLAMQHRSFSKQSIVFPQSHSSSASTIPVKFEIANNFHGVIFFYVREGQKKNRFILCISLYYMILPTEATILFTCHIRRILLRMTLLLSLNSISFGSS